MTNRHFFSIEASMVLFTIATLIVGPESFRGSVCYVAFMLLLATEALRAISRRHQLDLELAADPERHT